MLCACVDRGRTEKLKIWLISLFLQETQNTAAQLSTFQVACLAMTALNTICHLPGALVTRSSQQP